MIIPHDQLSPIALQNIIEEYVTRDGTELSDAEDKVKRVRERLERGYAVISYDTDTGTCTIVAADTTHGKKNR